jgi:hypothetical protein
LEALIDPELTHRVPATRQAPVLVPSRAMQKSLDRQEIDIGWLEPGIGAGVDQAEPLKNRACPPIRSSAPHKVRVLQEI